MISYFPFLCRCAETKQTFEKISHSLEAELAKAKESLMAPSLSNLKKEWIEQPGSIQVGVSATEVPFKLLHSECGASVAF